MLTTIGVTIGFGSSARLGGAVSTTMMLTTLLLLAAMIRIWSWPLYIALPLKIIDGGWLPLTLDALVFLIMAIWRSDVDAIGASYLAQGQSADAFLAMLTVQARRRSAWGR